MSTLQFIAALVGSLAWPVALVVAVVVLRRPLSAAFGRLKRVEGAGLALELAEAKQAREAVEGELAELPAQPDAAEVDELVRRAAELGWRLARIAPERVPEVMVDRSGDKPTVRSPAEDALRQSITVVNVPLAYTDAEMQAIFDRFTSKERIREEL
ncbi:hypothetical protein [Spongiactinospora sp. TRM90649]|uniref:hypothetical protein n=1 Tax=Spongiactinospora sp. TRM90649 TaxID=3031114 RepID=UPI0023FA2FA5|nr:hypothetical protein [Spongiactinospora sp. TRM90649]MDF5756625.1 hypothetical protein [Spongiactinospora sp. TRM90649]